MDDFVFVFGCFWVSPFSEIGSGVFSFSFLELLREWLWLWLWLRFRRLLEPTFSEVLADFSDDDFLSALFLCGPGSLSEARRETLSLDDFWIVTVQPVKSRLTRPVVYLAKILISGSVRESVEMIVPQSESLPSVAFRVFKWPPLAFKYLKRALLTSNRQIRDCRKQINPKKGNANH